MQRYCFQTLVFKISKLCWTFCCRFDGFFLSMLATSVYPFVPVRGRRSWLRERSRPNRLIAPRTFFWKCMLQPGPGTEIRASLTAPSIRIVVSLNWNKFNTCTYPLHIWIVVSFACKSFRNMRATLWHQKAGVPPAGLLMLPWLMIGGLRNSLHLPHPHVS